MLCCLETLVLRALPVYFSEQSLQTGLAGTLIIPGLYRATSSTWLGGWEPPQPRKWKDGPDIPLSLLLLHTQVIFIIYPMQFLTTWLAGHWWSGLNAECYFFLSRKWISLLSPTVGQARSSWEALCTACPDHGFQIEGEYKLLGKDREDIAEHQKQYQQRDTNEETRKTWLK